MINDSHASGSDLYYNRDRPSLRAWVSPGPNRILDLGCGSGAFGRKLLETDAAREIIGVEIFPSAAEEAGRHYQKVHVGDIEQMHLPYGPEFDYVTCGDILEHLKDPYSLIPRIRGWLKPKGILIASVPNVRHWSVLWGLTFQGAWEYQEAGIMDRTHLRFFTRRSLAAMVQNGGLQVERWQMFISGRKFKLLNRLSLGLLQEFFGSQVQVRAVKNS